MRADGLTGGFADAPIDAAQAFRALLDAMARPGRIGTLAGAEPPAPLSVAAGTLILTLCDRATPIHLAGAHDAAPVRDWVAFHTGAPLAPAAAAAFAVGTWDALLPLDRYPAGVPEYPDRSATLVVEMPALAPGGAVLTGPGIEHQATLGLPDPTAMARNARRFPLGLDFFLTAGTQVAGLPRSTRIAAA